MRRVLGVRKRTIIVGLALILMLGIGPQVFSQETGSNPIQQTAEIVFEGGARFINADALYENLNDGDPDNDPVTVSLRSSEDYAKGHVPGAGQMGLAALFTPEGLATLPPERSVVLICYTSQSASQATPALNMLGYDAYALQFGMSSWTSDPDVYVKRFDPEDHARDYLVDLEAHEPGGPYEMPPPLVEAVSQPTPEPVPPATVAEQPLVEVAGNCVSCHTNRDILGILAVEKEVKSEMASGEG